jgi:deoxyadenosine/deoxycytidine kinase
MVYITISGNIGTGKTTVLKRLEALLDKNSFDIISEPVDAWRNIRDETGKNPLQYFYDDPKKYAFNFQVLAFITRLNQIQAVAQNGRHIISERSLEEDRHVFARKLNVGGLISNIEYRTYCMWYETQAVKPHLVFYLDTPPAVCLERLKERDRKEEKCVGPEYLKSLDNFYNEWCLTTPIKLVRLNGLKTPDQLADDIITYLAENRIILS